MPVWTELTQGGEGAVHAALLVICELEEGAQADTETAERARCAGEMVAAGAGHPSDELPEYVRGWIGERGVPSEALVELALRAMKRLATTPADEETAAKLTDLRFRLGDAAAP